MALTINGTTGIETNTDTGRIKVGASDDLELYHDGSYSKLKTGGSSHLFIQADYDANQWLYLDAGHSIELRTTGYETAVKCNSNGSVELYYDNVKKMDTLTDGIGVLGVVYSQGLDVDDDHYIKVGSGDDLQIHHDGSHSYITNSTGYLHINSANIELKNAANNETMLLASENSDVELYYNNSKKFSTTDYGCEAKTIKPDSDNTHDLGASGERWDDVYATNGTIQTSDRNEKKDIVKSDLGLTFINAVEPVSYKFKTGTRTHYGVIAQDLETVLDGKDFAGLTKDTETGNYGVRYTELISPLIKAVQELSAEVETLKTKVAALEAG